MVKHIDILHSGISAQREHSAHNEHFRLIIGIFIVCFLSFLFRYYLDNSGNYLTQIYLERFYQGYMDRLLAEKPFWYFLLPMPEIKGVWATTGFVLIYFLERSLGPNAAFLVLATSATAAFGYGTWLILRRALPSTLAAAALGFSPFNYSVYLWNGSNNCYATIVFLALSFGFFGAYILHEARRVQYVLGAVFLVFGALSYESWLDGAAIMVALTPFIIIFCRRFGHTEVKRRYIRVFGFVLGAAVLYTLVRLSTLHNTAIPGLEFQMVWSHSTLGPLVDDALFNAVFMVYAAVVQFLPGFAGTSLAINEAGSLDIGVLQHGYQPNLYPVVAAHYLNLWLMYAGALVASLCFGAFIWLRRGLTQGSAGALVAGLLCLALLVGSPTHTLLKFVAFNGVAFYSYKVTVGLMVLFLAVAIAIDALDRRLQGPAQRIALVASISAYILLVAFTRPNWANENIREIWGDVGFFANGFYPDPWQNLKALTGMRS